MSSRPLPNLPDYENHSIIGKQKFSRHHSIRLSADKETKADVPATIVKDKKENNCIMVDFSSVQFYFKFPLHASNLNMNKLSLNKKR